MTELAAECIRIVIIDDNPGSLELLATALRHTGAAIRTASTPAEGLELIYALNPQLVITDLIMPGMSGLDVLAAVTAFNPLIDVILMTAHYTTETAVAAIRGGAADYLQKPVKLALLRERVTTLIASAERRQRARLPNAAQNAGPESSFEGLIARSAVMWDLFAMIERVAPHYRSLLIKGPTGAGKDLIAQALHRRSRVAGRFVVLNCSAVVETLFESELFGHVRGAFTGADRDKTGLLTLADGGTLFLDEIGDMPLATQAKLLRALQNQEVLPVGSLTPRKINVRILAATHRNLREDIKENRFREDLYYRLSMVELTVPALSERTEDIAPLAGHFVHRFNTEFGKHLEGLTPRALLALEQHSWPGNVRELEHVIGRAVMLADGPRIDIADLPTGLTHGNGATASQVSSQPESALAANERRLVEEALAAAAGNQSEAARRLGIGRDALRYKIKRFGL